MLDNALSLIQWNMHVIFIIYSYTSNWIKDKCIIFSWFMIEWMVSNFQQDFISDEIFLKNIIHVPCFWCYFPLFYVQPGFDWGQVDTNALAKCLLTLCRELKDTLCLEPRLVKLKSPVYILGKKFVIYIIKYNVHVHGFFVLFYNYTCK